MASVPDATPDALLWPAHRSPGDRRRNDRRPRQCLCHRPEGPRAQPRPDQIRNVCRDRCRAGSRQLVSAGGSSLGHGGSDHLRLRQGLQRRAIWARNALRLAGAAAGDARSGVPAAGGATARCPWRRGLLLRLREAPLRRAEFQRATTSSMAGSGIRFQPERARHRTTFCCVRLRDRDVAQQREALGVLGVNLVHTVFRRTAQPGPLPPWNVRGSRAIAWRSTSST
jgi:hypothetical protein